MKHLLLGCALIFTFSALKSQDQYIRNDSIDIIHYKFELKINDENDSLFGKATILLNVLSPITQLKLDLYSANKAEKGMAVSQVKSSGKYIQFEHNGEELLLDLSKDAGKHEIEVIYKGIPQDGLIISENKFGDRTFFCDNWPNRAHHYVPVIDHPYEKATSEFIITAPSHYQVISNGVLMEVIDQDNNLRKTRYRSYQPLPTKVMVFGAAKFAIKRSDSLGAIPVWSWVYPQEETKGFYDYSMTVGILDWFQMKIGSYPYNQLANVQSKTKYGGMENAGCIFYHENSIDGKRGSVDLYAHEIGHQWFGNSASEADWHHVWLSEGFATYLTEVYKQETVSDSAFRHGMNEAKRRVIRYTNKYPNSKIIDTTITELTELLNPCTYQKAAWFLHMLRNYVGDDVFWLGVRSYYNNHKYGNAFTKDFKVQMEMVSGKPLNLFFDRWLYSSELPEFDFKWSKKKGIQISQVGDVFFPVEVKFLLKYKNGEEELVVLNMDTPKVDLSLLDKKGVVAKIIFDPYKDILMKNVPN